MENKVYICKSTGMAVYLIKNGCQCRNVELDKYDDTKLIYLFIKDDHCRAVVEDFMDMIQRTKEQKYGEQKASHSASH